MDTVLFLCTGNYYRSRFSEEYFNYRAIGSSMKWRADSRGLQQNMSTLNNVGSISSTALESLREIDISPIMASRMPLSVSIRDFQNSTKIIALCEREHRPLMADLFPMYENMIEYWDIEDRPLWRPEHALPLLQIRIDDFIRQINSVPLNSTLANEIPQE